MSAKHTSKKHIMGLALGVLTALAVLCSQSCYYSLIEKTKSVEASGSADQSDEGTGVSVLTTDAVSYFVQVTLNQALHVITEIYSEAVDQTKTEVDLKVDFDSYFKTLFRLIISPNAP